MTRLALVSFLAVVMVGLSFVWQGATGFNLADEGFLWYGAQRVMLGEVPVRDFMAYDPGRYYWSAALMTLLDDNGIMSLRIAVAVFQSLGLLVALLSIDRLRGKLGNDTSLFLAVAAVILLFWMFPRHKLFDISLSIFLVSVLAFWARRPSARRYFLAGLAIGLVAVFGRNHGMYGLAGSLLMMLWLRIRPSVDSPSWLKALALWVAGLAVGYAPIIILAILEPGYVAAAYESLHFLFARKTTNLPLPIPWPWNVPFASLPLNEAIRNGLIGVFFVLLPLCGLLGYLSIFFRRCTGRPVAPMVAATVIMTPIYAHYAYSRADIGHLCQGIFPFLLASLLFCLARGVIMRWLLMSVLVVASCWVMLPVHPGVERLRSGEWTDCEISGWTLSVDPGAARAIKLLRTLAARYAPNGQSFIAPEFWPGAYPLLRRKAPVWEIYPLWPRDQAFEKEEIARLEAARPAFAMMQDIALDGREDLRFSNTHPLLSRYIIENFRPVTELSGPGLRIYTAKDAIR
ncbi:MAG: hypothetical protein LBU39_01360 [Desulfobulbaceae bacterium]|jgi:hypothetical protein|nr:hypothetical protein [Desulfobulbaceae bacterium]